MTDEKRGTPVLVLASEADAEEHRHASSEQWQRVYLQAVREEMLREGFSDAVRFVDAFARARLVYPEPVERGPESASPTPWHQAGPYHACDTGALHEGVIGETFPRASPKDNPFWPTVDVVTQLKVERDDEAKTAAQMRETLRSMCRMNRLGRGDWDEWVRNRHPKLFDDEAQEDLVDQ